MFTRLKVALIKRRARKRLGRVIAPLENLTAHPGVMIPFDKFNRALATTGLVPARLKRLGVLRAAQLVECPF